jgi:hypothetical protein
MPLLFGGDIYRQHVTTFSRLARVGMQIVHGIVRRFVSRIGHVWTDPKSAFPNYDKYFV